LRKREENIPTAQMKIEDISNLEVVWYETFNDKTKVIPTFVEGQVYKTSLMKMKIAKVECSHS
jgi:hypothetical protein